MKKIIFSIFFEIMLQKIPIEIYGTTQHINFYFYFNRKAVLTHSVVCFDFVEKLI